MSRLKKNFLLVLLQQFFLLGLPFLTIPYVSRVLGPHGIGLYSYSFSIVTLFINIFLLGSQLYAIREIAKVKEDKNMLSKVFSEIFLIRTILLILALIIYWITANLIGRGNSIFIWQSLHLVGALFDITWLFQGMENFKKVVTRNLFIKLVGFGSVFLFVKDENDLILYTLIMAFSIVLGNLALFYRLKEQVILKISLSKISLKRHLKQMIILFIPSFSVMIYSVLDKTMLGSLSTTSQLGFYEQASKIVLMIFSLISVSGTVMLPRNSALISSKNFERLFQILQEGITYTAYLVLPLTFGLIIIAKDFVLWFLGPDFSPSIAVVIIMAPIVIFKSLGIIFGSWYFVPMEKNKEYTLPIVIGAVINFVLNIILIPKYNAIGATVATLITEAIILGIQIWFLRKVLNIKDIFKQAILKYLLIAIFMAFVSYKITLFYNVSGLTSIILKFIIGVWVYGGILCLIKDKPTLQLLSKIKIIKVNKKSIL
ncbi:flippase [Priestia megaterium]|uniref:flippase n=1 Tax=Priestia megaterium TaxID=1404 RepID=UPI00279580DB|nr:flippase [Priestia megaterium]